MNGIRAVVFDFDGLIIDTESAWYEALSEICQEYKVTLPLEKWALCVGTSHDVFDPYHYLLEQMQEPIIDRTSLVAYAGEKHAQIMKNIGLRPGVVEYLQTAKEHGLKIGLASSSNRKWIDEYLSRFELQHYFSCIRTSDDVEKVKPDPELYIQALKGLGVSPSSAVAFEDSPNGARAARAAGMYCVIVPNPITATLSFDHVHLRLNSMADKGLIEVLSSLEKE